MIDCTIYNLKIVTTEKLLGTQAKQKAVYAAHIANKTADMGLAEEEIQTVEEVEARGWTGFATDEKGVFIYNYQLKGFLCESARVIRNWGALKNLQSKFKQSVFVTPRRIRLPEIEEEPFERPLRAQTAQGPRVTVVRSDTIAAGAEISAQLQVLDNSGITKNCIMDVLDYGQLMGLGQFRSGSFGTFEVVTFEEA